MAELLAGWMAANPFSSVTTKHNLANTDFISSSSFIIVVCVLVVVCVCIICFCLVFCNCYVFIVTFRVDFFLCYHVKSLMFLCCVYVFLALVCVCVCFIAPFYNTDFLHDTISKMFTMLCFRFDVCLFAYVLARMVCVFTCLWLLRCAVTCCVCVCVFVVSMLSI